MNLADPKTAKIAISVHLAKYILKKIIFYLAISLKHESLLTRTGL
jgi:hypothetical protein